MVGINSIFPKNMRKRQAARTETSTLHGFSGGWNAVDDDQSMAPRYLKDILNLKRTPAGGQEIRWGSEYWVDIKSVRDEPIVDGIYFNGRELVVTTGGHILTITDAGAITEIWSDAIAAALPGAPSGWTGGVTQVEFVPFKNTLVIHNGKDKPLSIASTFAVTYLQDLATGSNVNVPIGKYGCVASNYHCVAGIDGSPTEIIISAAGTSGTFPSDPAPNDAISIDVGAYAPEGAAEIRGIAGYRTNLIVFLQGISIQVTLGEYSDTGTHTPKFPDTFPKFGLVGHRCITNVENDLIFGGLGGLSSASRNIYTTALGADYVSSVIDPAYRAVLGALTDDEQKLNAFMVYDQLDRDLMLFTGQDTVLVYTSNKKLNYKAWTKFGGMDYTWGNSSFLGRVFLGKGTKIFQMGNRVFGEKFYADKMDDRDYVWANSITITTGDLVWDAVGEKSYTALVTHTAPDTGTFQDFLLSHVDYFDEYLGVPISFMAELPWFNGKDGMKVKFMKFIGAATTGTAEFLVEAFVDNFFKDQDGNEIYDPAVSLVLLGNDAQGFGDATPDMPFGSGRRSNDGRRWKFPAKFKMIKFRITGSTRKPLALLSFSFLFSRGNYYR